MMTIRMPLLLILLAAPVAWSQDDDRPAELEPLIVEGQRSELDSRAAIYRDVTPCIGECGDAQDRAGPVERVLRGIRTLFIASSLPERPRPQDSLGIVNPTQARLDQKLP